MDIQNLINSTTEFLEKSDYSHWTIKSYASSWEFGILAYMNRLNISDYTPDIGQEFLADTITSEMDAKTVQRRTRRIHILNDYLSLGYIRKRSFQPKEYNLQGEIGRNINAYLEYLTKKRRSSSTISTYKLHLSNFLYYLNDNKLLTMDSITEKAIISFVATRENNQENIISTLRGLFKYLYHNKLIRLDFETTTLSFFKGYEREKIPSYYTGEEVKQIEASIDRSGGLGKRNYAILLLATRLGLRASDIANLKFSNIIWESNKITLTQYKTKAQIDLPLLTDVGNAIIDYLKYGRKKSSIQNIFISSAAPITAATKNMICSAISLIIKQSGVLIGKRHYGPHSMRHSLATILMENEIAMPVISEVLGHKSTETTMKYLKIDIHLLQKCALDVSNVDNEFYEQGGGFFYE
ncbi:site-specific integrase [Dysgonomonas sp. ZJ709]|uniref:site-specific integrase n=1 Tax=Dysgonomonas sp. ZJ709 TaxID=2709797 RepID=UPI0013ED7A34|nr:site-specific integrase [Dysgonomonas sp. ZJ709]